MLIEWTIIKFKLLLLCCRYFLSLLRPSKAGDHRSIRWLILWESDGKVIYSYYPIYLVQSIVVWKRQAYTYASSSFEASLLFFLFDTIGRGYSMAGHCCYLTTLWTIIKFKLLLPWKASLLFFLFDTIGCGLDIVAVLPLWYYRLVATGPLGGPCPTQKEKGLIPLLWDPCSLHEGG